MLLGSKSIIGQDQIDFLGMRLNNGRYESGPYLAEELLKFLDENLTQKHIQMFLEIINYIMNFILHAANYTSQLSKLLKK